MHKLILAATAGALALGVATASGASADTSGDTTTTFTMSGGALAITAPATATLSAAGAGTGTGTLGPVTVTDDRAALHATWTASASSSDFTSTVSGAAAIGKENVGYWSGAATASTGTATTVPGQATVANQVELSSPATAFSATDTVGNNSTTWKPTITVTVPSDAIAGDYTGTITHSVA